MNVNIKRPSYRKSGRENGVNYKTNKKKNKTAEIKDSITLL